MRAPYLTSEQFSTLKSMSDYWTEIEHRNAEFSKLVFDNEFHELCFEIKPEQLLRIISFYVEQQRAFDLVNQEPSRQNFL